MIKQNNDKAIKQQAKQQWDKILKQLTDENLTNYLKCFMSIKQYKKIQHGRDLLNIIENQTNQSKLTQPIKMICYFFDHTKYQGKVCGLQFIKQLMEIGKVKIFSILQKYLIPHLAQIIQYRSNIKTVARGSTYFLKEMDKNQKQAKSADMIRISNTYCRMSHEMLYIWGTFYFPTSHFGELYSKLAKQCVFPQYPKEFKFYKIAKVEQNVKNLQFKAINQYIQTRKYTPMLSARSKMSSKSSTNLLEDQNKQQKIIKNNKIVKSQNSNQFLSQKNVDKIQFNKQQKQQQINISQKAEKKKITKKQNIKQNIQQQVIKIKKVQQNEQQIDDVFNSDSNISKIYRKQSKIVSKPNKSKLKYPPNIIYRQSSIEDPIDACKQIDNKQKKQLQTPMLSQKKNQIQIPMGIINQLHTQQQSSKPSSNVIKPISSIKNNEQSKASQEDKGNKNKKEIIQEEISLVSTQRVAYYLQSSVQISQIQQYDKNSKNVENKQINKFEINNKIIQGKINQVKNKIQVKNTHQRDILNIQKQQNIYSKKQNGNKIFQERKEHLQQKNKKQIITNNKNQEVYKKQQILNNNNNKVKNKQIQTNNNIKQIKVNTQISKKVKQQKVKQIIINKQKVTERKQNQNTKVKQQNNKSQKKFFTQQIQTNQININEKSNKNNKNNQIRQIRKNKPIQNETLKVFSTSSEFQKIHHTQMQMISHTSRKKQQSIKSKKSLSIKLFQQEKKPFDNLKQNQELHSGKHKFQKKLSFSSNLYAIKQLVSDSKIQQKIEKQKKISTQRNLRKFREVAITLLPHQGNVKKNNFFQEMQFIKGQKQEIQIIKKELNNQFKNIEQKIQFTNKQIINQVRNIIEEHQQKFMTPFKSLNIQKKPKNSFFSNGQNYKSIQLQKQKRSNIININTLNTPKVKRSKSNSSKRSSLSQLKLQQQYQDGTMLHFLQKRKSVWL